MTKIKIILGMMLTFMLAKSQDSNDYYYNSLSYSGEAFFDTLVEQIRVGKYANNDTLYWSIDSAITHYKKTSQTCDLSYAYALKAKSFFVLGVHDSSEVNFIKAAKNHDSSCSDFEHYYLYFYWAWLQEELNEYDIGDSLYHIALASAENLEDKTYELNTLNNLANVKNAQGEVREAINTMKSVQSKALEYEIEYHHHLSLQNLGAYMLVLGKMDSARYYFNTLVELVNEDSNPRMVADLMNNLGFTYDDEGNFEKAEEYYLKAIHLAKENSYLKPLLIYLENISILKKQQGKFEESRQYLREYVDLKDSLYNEEKYQTIKDLETKYHTSKQREIILELEKKSLKQNLELERHKLNLYALYSVLGGLVIILIAALSRLSYIRRSKKIVEREKKRSDELLLNILPEEVALELKNTGESEARDFDDVTVLFTDFKDFTQISEELSAKELVHEVNECFKKFDEVIQKYNIEKIKTIGDAYMAAGGLNNPEHAQPNMVVKAAIEMRDFMVSRKTEREKQKLPAFEMRVGIHTGPVVAGIVGVKKFQYDIWGDTVNTASRMETEGQVSKINISQVTHDLIMDSSEFKFENRGRIKAKGKGAIHMFFVEKK